jgi:hypothetical protein
MENPTEVSKLELLPRERRFLERVVLKFSNDGNKPLLRSLLIITLLIAAGHLIERSNLPAWAAFALIYCPALWLFFRYRKMSIFKSRLMRKLYLLNQASTQDNSSCEMAAESASLVSSDSK